MEERQHHEFHPNSYPGASPSCSAADHRPNFSGDAYPNHQQYYNSNMYPQKQQQQQQHYNHDRQFNNGSDQFHHSYPQPPHPVNNEHSEPFGGGGFRSNGGGGGAGGFASPQSTPFNGRKRGFHHSGPGAPPDQVDCGHAKLYVVPIPRTATVEDIRPLFEQHGNVIEVVLFKDKRTGQQQGSCFVKYATLDDAERAIKALNNRHTFSGELGPIKLRLAEGERERLATWRHHQEGGGGVVDKLYVRNVNRQASNNDIEEIFSQFGFVEDVYIVRDEQRQSRGCAFVKFPRREMALAAIKALNGTFTMRGCDHPLIVRFAEPKKPRTGEPRGNFPIAGPNLGPFSQEPGFRPASSHGVPFGGQILPNAAYPVQQNHTSPNVQAVSQVPIQETTVPVFTQQNPQLYQSPGQIMPQMPLHQRQTHDTCPRSIQQTDSETQKQIHMRSSTQTLEQQPILQHTKQESPENRKDHHTVASLLPANPQTATLLECDWSEHTCPDGDKYYYNCVTRQSRWEKPEEFSLFEKQLKNQQQLCNPSKPLQSLPSDLSTQEVVPMPQDLDHVKLQSETSPVIGSICVQ